MDNKMDAYTYSRLTAYVSTIVGLLKGEVEAYKFLNEIKNKELTLAETNDPEKISEEIKQQIVQECLNHISGIMLEKYSVH